MPGSKMPSAAAASWSNVSWVAGPWVLRQTFFRNRQMQMASLLYLHEIEQANVWLTLLARHILTL